MGWGTTLPFFPFRALVSNQAGVTAPCPQHGFASSEVQVGELGDFLMVTYWHLR